ncbi:DUF5060 domain-containing protein [uncultured Draconibacterium sp.]|uniref:DUF5060 domain-containing protein n=1 Tax=uncultured Draconibacterium sp. TaxID=1573823 RepID=UPI0029C85C58|nr:DUF5060 domain-containing protein [uncultured Draconibacterium sp.]
MIQLKQILAALVVFCALVTNAQETWSEIPKIEIYQCFELSMQEEKEYKDPFRDVELMVELTSPEGRKLTHYGFYDGNETWKVGFSPDERG